MLFKNFQLVETQLKIINEELLTQPYQYLTSIHSRIELILVEINRTKVNRGDEIYKPDALFLKFLELVRANFKNNFPLSHFAKLSVKEVAAKLGFNDPFYFSNFFKKHTKESPKLYKSKTAL